MFLLRPSRLDDAPALLELARVLDSVNLPPDERFLRSRLERSLESFRRLGPPDPETEFQFMLEDGEGRAVGTCAVLSKHGTPEMPHFYLEVGTEERASRSIGVRARHVTLKLRQSTDGPTEIGALVLHPEARGQPGSPGKLLSWGRFNFVARHRECFEDEMIAEMRAAFDPGGRNRFWEAFGRRFTGLSYQEADRRSAVDKSFIRDLFPRAKIYASLLDDEVVEHLGQVHADTRAAVRLLEQAGFEWNGQIDPFDAGPYYGAPTARVLPVRETIVSSVARGKPSEDAALRIVSAGRGSAFRGTVGAVEEEDGSVRVSKGARERLGITEGEEVAITPLPRRRSARTGRG